jgi:E3 ubiquitin-protein ligase RNF115/126
MFQIHGDMRDYVWGANGLDQIISQLLNQLENTGPPPATTTQLENLPIVTISEADVERNLECAICFDDFQLNDKGRRLPCKHIFHEPCITEWLKLHGTCPICRKNMSGEDTSQREYISQAPTTSNAAAATPPPPPPETVPTEQQPTVTTTTITSDSNSTTNTTNNNNNTPVDDMDFD